MIQNSVWYHLAGTHDRATKTVAIYAKTKSCVASCLNGKKEGEKEFDHDVMVTTKHLWIGNLGDHELFFGGKIDEVAFLNIALSDADIKIVMNGGLKAVFSIDKLATTWGFIKKPMIHQSK